MITSALSLSKEIVNPLTHLNSIKEFFMLASPILKELSASNISSTAKSLWKVILDLSKKTKSLTCSYARSALAKMINRSVRTVTTLVAELEDHGFLNVSRGYASPTRRRINVYHITLPQYLIEKVMQEPNRKKKFQTKQRSDAMERLCTNDNSSSIYAPSPLEEYSLHDKDDSAENCTIDKKEDLNNNNNLTDNPNSISVPISVCVKEFNVFESQGLLVYVKSLVNAQYPEILDFMDAIKNQFESGKYELIEEIKVKCQKIGESRKELEHIKEHEFHNMNKIMPLTIKERILCEERNSILDYKDELDSMIKNSSFIYVLTVIFKKYEQYKHFYGEKKKISANKSSYFENRESNSEYEQVEQAETMCSVILSEIKSDISRHQINAKLAFFLKDPCFVGHDLRVHDPKIPKNILNRYFEQVQEIIKDDTVYEIFNEMAASVRFGELSRCKDEEGRISFIKGFNVALKLLREGRWTTPKCVSVVLEMIPYSELKVNINGISLFEDVNRQLDSMGLSI
jgi:hypothetical protein